MTVEHTDITIVGGGLVGLTLAIALNDYPGKVTLIEAVSPQRQTQHEYDARSIALAHGNRRFLTSLGVWDKIAAWATPIHDVHISDRGHFGKARLSALQEQVPALGYVIEIPDLYNALLERVAECKNIHRLCPVKVDAIEKATNEHWNLTLSDQTILQTNLVIAADGIKSPIRQSLNIPAKEVEYGHNAIITNVTLKHSHNNIAYERFTRKGPVALLPLQHNRAALIWTQAVGTEQALVQASDATFISELQNVFSHLAGEFVQVGKRDVFPLKSVWVSAQIHRNLVFLGNAAHTLHPVAGQGFNLSLQDISALADQLNQAGTIKQELLEAYYKQRKPKQQRTLLITDILARQFATNFTPWALARNMALSLLDKSKLPKHLFTRYLMGL